jgi:hypothetical protein
VNQKSAGQDSKVRIQTARQELAGVIGGTPFYKKGTARKSMAAFL